MNDIIVSSHLTAPPVYQILKVDKKNVYQILKVDKKNVFFR